MCYVFYRGPRVRRLYSDGATQRLCVKNGGDVIEVNPTKIHSERRSKKESSTNGMAHQEYGVRLILIHYLTIAHHQFAVGHIGEVLVVCDDDKRNSEIVSEFEKQLV